MTMKARAHAVSTTTRRRWDPSKRSKARLCCWLSATTLADLKTRAHDLDMPISELAETFLRTGLQTDAARVLEDTALPRLEVALQKVMREQVAHTEERLAKLLVRIALETGTARRLVYIDLTDRKGRETSQQMNQAAYTAAVNALKERGWEAAVASLHLDRPQDGQG